MLLDVILDKISVLKTYKDTKETRKVMSDIVTMIKNTPENMINFDIVKLKKIWNVMYKTEYQLENKLGYSIITSSNPWHTLEHFIYYKNYELLVMYEMESILSVQQPCKNILFVGGGPVPLSAILIAKKYNTHVFIIDNNINAVKKSKLVIKKLELEDKITIECADIVNYQCHLQFDAIIIAAMVLTYNNHEAIMQNIKTITSSQNHFIIRTTSGVHQLFYMPISYNLINQYFTIKQQFHPKKNSDLINSFYLGTIQQ